MDYSSYTDMFGKRKCDCGKTHDFTVKCLLSHGAFGKMHEFLAEFVPSMSRVVLVYDDEALMQAIYGNIKREFRVACVKVEDDKRLLDLVSVPEDSKLVLAVGSHKAINGAKYKAYTCDLPVIIASKPDFGALTSLCTISENGAVSTYEVAKPIGYIFDLDCELTDRDKAELFGTVAARLNTSFEYYASSVLAAHEYCPYIAGALSDIAAQTVLKLAGSDAAPSDLLLEAALKVGLLCSTENFDRSGEEQCGLTYAALNDGAYTQGELQFVFASVLSSLFKAHIRSRKDFVPPPDNNYRTEHIAQLFGISEFKAISTMIPQISGREAAVTEYKIREYSPDFIEKLDKNINLYRPAFKIFKRLYADDGFSLEDLLNSDIPISISLAPDIINGSGMLTTLKKLGELDQYLI